MKTKILTFLFWIGVAAQVATASPMQYVNSFYRDAYNHYTRVPVKDIQIAYADLSQSNGKIMTLDDGSILIVIDRSFYNYFYGKSQIKRLIYYLLAHELMGRDRGSGIMNQNRVYYKLKSKHVDALFYGKR